jgi:hypothetical protein
VTIDQFVPILAWCALVLWVGGIALFAKRQTRASAALNALLALPFLVGPLITLVKWRIDPPAYVRQYGTGALHELSVDGVVLALSVLALLACALVFRGRRLWAIIAFALNAAAVLVLFYFAYFFHIF